MFVPRGLCGYNQRWLFGDNLLVTDQGTESEFTVVLKFKQATFRKRAVIVFGTFLGKQTTTNFK